MTRIVLALLAALLAVPAAAQAAPEGTTLLQSRTSGLDPFPNGLANSSVSNKYAISANGCRVAFESDADGMAPDDDNRHRNVFVRDACTEKTILVSRADGAAGAPANAGSYSASISPNGRYVAFTSGASNMGANLGGVVYLRDLEAKTTAIVSRRTGTTAGPVGYQGEAPVVSNDGKVVFTTAGQLDDADTDTKADAYLRDGTTTTLLSRTDAGAAGAIAVTISADGTAIGLTTAAKLTADDANTAADAYVRRDGAWTLVSRRDGAEGAAAGGTNRLALNADGTVVAFETVNDIDPKDTNGVNDVYRRKGASTVLVSRKDGADTTTGQFGSVLPVVDASGDRIAFVTTTSDLTADAPAAGNDVFLRDVPASRTTLQSRRGADGPAAGDSTMAAIAGSGTHVTYQTQSDPLLDGDENDFWQVVRRRVADGVTDHVSRPDGAGDFDGDGVNAAIGSADIVSRDGRYVAFVSASDALVDGDNDVLRNAYVRDNLTHTTTQVNLTDADVPAAGGATDVAISDDGRRVAIVTSERLDPEHDTNAAADVYVRDRVAGTTYLASRPTGSGTRANTSNLEAKDVAISGDGAKVAFVTNAKLDDADVNAANDVHVRDLATHTTTVASRADGQAGAVAGGENPALDRDGSRVAFETSLKLHNLDVAHTDVYVRDLEAHATHFVSRASGENGVGGATHSYNASISADGNRVTFDSYSSNLGTNGHQHVHVRDLAASETILVTKTAENQVGVGTSGRGVISADGTRVAFESTAANLGGTGGYARIIVKDLATGSLVHASAPSGATGHVPGDSRVPAISANGRCVAFVSRAAVTPGVHVPGDFDQVFLRAVSGECPDATAPDTTITEQPAPRVATQDVEFAFVSTEGGDRFECRQDDGAWYACSATATWEGAAEGPHTFRVRAIDEAGNVDATPATSTFHVDLTAPETAIDSGPSGRIKETTAQFAFSGSDDAFFQCQVDGQGWEDCDPPSITLEALTDGEHTFEVRTYDFAGHVDATPAKRVFVVDTVGPEVTVSSLRAGDDGVLTAVFSAEGAVRCAVDSTELEACTSPFTRGGLSAGTHVLRLQATDDLGNAGPVVERTFVVPAKPAPKTETRTETKADPAPAAGSPAPAAPAPAVAVPSGSPRAAAAAAAKVGRATVKKGRAVVVVTCPPAAEGVCRGAITVRAKGLGVVARGRYSVAAGKRVTLRLKLTAKARRAKRLALTARAA